MRYYSPSSCLLFVVFILPVVASSPKNTSATDSTTLAADVTWTSPLSGEKFEPGQTIVASWTTPQKIDSPSFSLCMQETSGQDCGSSVHPTVATAQSTSQQVYSMSIVIPNITVQGSFFIKMQSDGGDSFQSPGFALAPAPNITVTNSAPTTGFSGVSFPPSSLSAHSVPARSNAVAIGVPVTMIGLTVLGALAYLLSKRRREEREAGGSSTSRNLGPTIITPSLLSNSRSTTTSEKGKQQLDTGEASFFSIALNKTRSEMTGVEKAVAGVLGGTGLVPDQSHAIRDVVVEPVRPIGDGRRSRMRLSEEDEGCYTTLPPPRSWQGHRVRERDRSDNGIGGARSWVVDKQVKRAEERERDRLWELERRERAQRRLMMSRPTSHPSYGYMESSRMGYRIRSAEEYYDPRGYHEAEKTYHRPDEYEEFHDYRRQSAPPEYHTRDRHPMDPMYHPEDRPLSGSPYPPANDPNDHRPTPRSLTAAYMPHSHSQPAAMSMDVQYRLGSPSRQALRRPMSDNLDYHSTLSVLSPYLKPSPFPDFPASPYIPPRGPSGVEHPLFLQAGRPGTSSLGPVRPPGLEHVVHPSRPASRNTLPSFAPYADDFGRRSGEKVANYLSSERDDREVRLYRMAHGESWSGVGERRHQSRMGDYFERPLPRRPGT
ncbi:hypothetical protein FRB95_002945 [Tulasnella sp. JGI-2019a]|nr:hypothetical protein FRB95_002945 [Tulasnella sp. JGI-2019a]